MPSYTCPSRKWRSNISRRSYSKYRKVADFPEFDGVILILKAHNSFLVKFCHFSEESFSASPALPWGCPVSWLVFAENSFFILLNWIFFFRKSIYCIFIGDFNRGSPREVSFSFLFFSVWTGSFPLSSFIFFDCSSCIQPIPCTFSPLDTVFFSSHVSILVFPYKVFTDDSFIFIELKHLLPATGSWWLYIV